MTRTAARDVRVVAAYTLAIMLTTLLAVGLLSWRAGGATLPLSIPVTVVLLATNLLSRSRLSPTGQEADGRDSLSW